MSNMIYAITFHENFSFIVSFHLYAAHFASVIFNLVHKSYLTFVKVKKILN